MTTQQRHLQTLWYLYAKYMATHGDNALTLGNTRVHAHAFSEMVLVTGQRVSAHHIFLPVYTRDRFNEHQSQIHSLVWSMPDHDYQPWYKHIRNAEWSRVHDVNFRHRFHLPVNKPENITRCITLLSLQTMAFCSTRADEALYLQFFYRFNNQADSLWKA